MKSSTTTEFWTCYSRLPPQIKRLARKNFKLWLKDPQHGSLHFKKVRGVWSIRVSRQYRTLGLDKGDTVQWFWIGGHDEYERILRSGTIH